MVKVGNSFCDVETITTSSEDTPCADFRLQVVIHGSVMYFPLPERGQISVGRALQHTIRIVHPTVSRTHFHLTVDDAFWLTPEPNAKPVCVNGLPANGPVSVHVGDILHFGDVWATIESCAHSSVKGIPSSIQVGNVLVSNPRDTITNLAQMTHNVLIVGESGVGKMTLLHGIHAASKLAKESLTLVNCRQIGSLHEAFQHDHESRAMLFQDVDSLSLQLQAQFQRLLSSQEQRTVRRMFATTSVSLSQLVAQGQFRRDFYDLLAEVVLNIPPLRERPDDVGAFVRQTVGSLALELGKPLQIRDSDIRYLQGQPWPGNYRELRNVLRQAALMATDYLHFDASSSTAAVPEEDLEKSKILDALAACGGNQTRAAKMLKISRRTLINRLDQYGVNRPIKSAKSK